MNSLQNKMAAEAHANYSFTINEKHRQHILHFHSASSTGQASKFFTDEMDEIIDQIADVVSTPDTIIKQKRRKKYVINTVSESHLQQH